MSFHRTSHFSEDGSYMNDHYGQHEQHPADLDVARTAALRPEAAEASLQREGLHQVTTAEPTRTEGHASYQHGCRECK